MIFNCEIYTEAKEDDPKYSKTIEIEAKDYSELEQKVFEQIKFDESWIICNKEYDRIGNIWWTGADAESCEY